MRVEYKGFKEFDRALARNPKVVKSEVSDFLVKGMREYNKGIIRNPWRVGKTSGGTPVAKFDGGMLRDTHKREFEDMEARIYPTRPYASYVHEGTRKMEKRPWLDHVKEKSSLAIIKLHGKMMDNIIKDLAN